MLKQEQIRPFLLGALFTAGVAVVTHYIGANEGYFTCVGDTIKTYHQDDIKGYVDSQTPLEPEHTEPK